MMSSRRLIIAPDAQMDLQNILRVSRKEWGEPQRARYSQQLMDAMSRLTEFPDLGQQSEQFATRLRSFRSGQHVIYYRDDNPIINVVRILHVKMDAAAQFRT